MNPVLQAVVDIVVAGGGAAVILYGIFAKWGEKWLDDRFATRLKELEHVHARELENVRHAIQSTFSRISKVHEREFEVFPKIWLMIHETLGQGAHAVGATIIQLPTFKNISDEDLNEYFDSIKLTVLERTKIMKNTDADERHKTCREIVMYKNMWQAKDNQRILNNTIIENRIFMTPELDTMLTEVSHMLGTGLGTYEIGRRCSDHKLTMEGFTTVNSLSAKLPPILAAIQDRLCHDVAGLRIVEK